MENLEERNKEHRQETETNSALEMANKLQGKSGRERDGKKKVEE